MIISEPLFNKEPISDFLNKKRSQLQSHLRNISEQDFLANMDAIKNQTIIDYQVRLPNINEKKEETTKKISEETTDLSRYANDGITQPDYQNVFTISLYTKFTGDPELFDLRPRMLSSPVPRGKIGDNLIITKLIVEQDSRSSNADIVDEWRRNLDNINKHLDYLKNDIDSFNRSLSETINEYIADRTKTIDKRNSLNDDLGFSDK